MVGQKDGEPQEVKKKIPNVNTLAHMGLNKHRQGGLKGDLFVSFTFSNG